MNIEFKGIDKLISALKQAPATALEALGVAVVDEMDAVMEEAKRRTPVDTGTLRGSGVVVGPEKQGTQVTAIAGFGGAASDYAVVVHEDLSASHGVGEAKFLERPMLERAGQIPRNLAVRLAQYLGRLG